MTEKLQLYELVEAPQTIEDKQLTIKPLRELLTHADLEHIKKKGLYWISLTVQHGESTETVFAPIQQLVICEQITINRNRASEIIGLPFVMGG